MKIIEFYAYFIYENYENYQHFKKIITKEKTHVYRVTLY